MSYDPFWLRLGLEIVTQRAVNGGGAAVTRAGVAGPVTAGRSDGGDEELRAFVSGHFLGDEDLARESEAARGAAHYDAGDYWVSIHPPNQLLGIGGVDGLWWVWKRN
jgi:hypothetical protein